MHNDEERPVYLRQASEAGKIPQQMWEAFDLAQLSALLGAWQAIDSNAARDGQVAIFGLVATISLSSNRLARWCNGVNMLGPTADDAEWGGA